MTVTDQIKILDSKIKSNQEQYDLGREATKISVQSSKNLLEEHEYLTGEDLGYKPNVFEKTKSEYSPLGMSLNKLKKMRFENLLRVRVISIVIATTPFSSFTKGLMNLNACHQALSTL